LVASLPALQRFDSGDQTASITQAVLQLLLAVSHAHMKAVGASSGLGAVSAMAVKWAPVFDLTPVDQLLPFVRGLLLPPGGAALAQMFSTQICGSLGRVLLAQHSSDGQPDPQQQELTSQTLGLLVDCCQQLQPDPVIGSSLPLLMTAQPGGLQLAAYVRQLAGSWSNHSNSRFDLLSVWAGLQLLPYACDKAVDAVAACQAVVEAIGSAGSGSPVNTAAAAAGQVNQQSNPVNVDLLQLRAAASSMLAKLLPQVAADWLPAAAAAALEIAQQHPLHLATVESATQLLIALRSTLTESTGSTLAVQAAQSARDLLSHARLTQVSTAVMPALLARSQSIRAAALQLLTAFDQPPYVVAPPVADVPGLTKAGTGHTSGQTPAFTGVKCEVLTVLRDMHCQPCSLEAGRSWSAALGRIEGHLEYGRLPVDLVPTVVAALVGVCYIR
jgi:U3 small nucleolar RNA-associated protein 20